MTDKIVDKLDNLEDVFEKVNEYFGIDYIRLTTDDDSTMSHFSDIYMQSLWDDGKQRLYHLITIRDGQIRYNEYYETIHHRLFSFIEQAGYEVNPFTRTLILILHEFGHINRTNTMYMFNQETMCDLIDNVTGGLLNNRQFLQMTAQCIVKEGVDLKYMLDSNEMYADAFAMKYFIPVHRHVKEKLEGEL